jgi:hypothetical protein
MTDTSICGTCGRVNARLVRARPDPSTLPDDVDLVRPRNFRGLILASERFADAIEAEKLRGGLALPLADFV